MIRLTQSRMAVLRVFLADDPQPHYCNEIIGITRLTPGTVYPTLLLLYAEGWLTRRTETWIEQRRTGVQRQYTRPRTFYTFTEYGRRQALAAARWSETHPLPIR